MSLKPWLNNGWLVPHKTSPQEIADLLAVADRDFEDCQTEGLSVDWRLNIAYNAGSIRRGYLARLREPSVPVVLRERPIESFKKANDKCLRFVLEKPQRSSTSSSNH